MKTIGGGQAGRYIDLAPGRGQELHDFWRELLAKYPDATIESWGHGEQLVVRVLVWEERRPQFYEDLPEPATAPREYPRDRLQRGDPHVVLWHLNGIVEIRFDSDGYHYVVEEE